MDNIAIRIRLVRKAMHLTQKQFANSIGLSNGTAILRYEKGLRRPGTPTIKMISIFTGKSENWLINGHESDINQKSSISIPVLCSCETLHYLGTEFVVLRINKNCKAHNLNHKGAVSCQVKQ
jgi:transcriptional regulator with XRE-family HTH domain